MSHAGYLREFWLEAGGGDDDWRTCVRALWDAGVDCDRLAPPDAVERMRRDLADPARTPGLDDADRAVLAYVSVLTLRPHATSRTDAEAQLRAAAGLDDAGILDVVQVTACFAYMNRLADGTGVLTMPKHADLEATLFSADEIAAHKAWGAREA